MVEKSKLKKYSELIIKEALKIKDNDVLVIRSPISAREFTLVLVEEAYNNGAKNVIVDWRDQEVLKLKLIYENDTELEYVPQYFIDMHTELMDKKAKFLSITGEDPQGLDGVDPLKFAALNKAKQIALKDFSQKMMSNYTSWCVVGASEEAWSKLVFPNEEDSYEKLWDHIFYTTKVEEDDVVKTWENHVKTLQTRANFLNENKFKKLKYKTEKGTDLEVELPENYLFMAAGEKNSDNEEFIANIPTEEVFSAPHKYGVNGIIYNTLPLNYNGNIIDDFYLKFKDGKVEDFDAKKGYEVLKNLLNTDEGASRLGEIALVPYDSPIRNTEVLFYNTLYDENASCHFALGKAYPTCVKDGDEMDEEELDKAGINDSVIHVDFMVGDKTLSIIGIKENGEEVTILKGGNFVND